MRPLPLPRWSSIRSYSVARPRSNKSSIIVKQQPQKLADSLPHASPTLISLDSFFALHRPLLELPLRLSNRKSVLSKNVTTPLEEILEECSEKEIQGMETVELETLEIDSDELVEVIDLSIDGLPIGSSYLTTLSASNEDSVNMKEFREAERALKELEDSFEKEGLDPYEAWLISEPDQGSAPWSPKISRYLASKSPFVPPPPPAIYIPPKSIPILSSSINNLNHSVETLANINWLRPFQVTKPTLDPFLTSTTASTFSSKFINPISPTVSQAMTDRFLSAASLNHRWQAQVDFASSTAEAMELAKRSFIGEDISTRSTAGRIKRRGDLRIWSVEEGWKFVKVAKSELVTEEGSSPFLPADLAVWAAEDDEIIQKDIMLRGKVSSTAIGPRSLAEKTYRIGMDSTKRKRKKKITKHKFKKRRKAQKALRQKLGK